MHLSRLGFACVVYTKILTALIVKERRALIKQFHHRKNTRKGKSPKKLSPPPIQKRVSTDIMDDRLKLSEFRSSALQFNVPIPHHVRKDIQTTKQPRQRHMMHKSIAPGLLVAGRPPHTSMQHQRTTKPPIPMPRITPHRSISHPPIPRKPYENNRWNYGHPAGVTSYHGGSKPANLHHRGREDVVQSGILTPFDNETMAREMVRRGQFEHIMWR